MGAVLSGYRRRPELGGRVAWFAGGDGAMGPGVASAPQELKAAGVVDATDELVRQPAVELSVVGALDGSALGVVEPPSQRVSAVRVDADFWCAPETIRPGATQESAW
jgi:hypothetical protein